MKTTPAKPRVFIDSDVLFAGCAAPGVHGASLVVLRMAEITLIDAIASEQVIIEVERNLSSKFPKALPAFRMIVSRCLSIVSMPKKSFLAEFNGLAHPGDQPILAAAVRENCPYLVSFNLRHFEPGHPLVEVLPPGDFILRVRDLLARI